MATQPPRARTEPTVTVHITAQVSPQLDEDTGPDVGRQLERRLGGLLVFATHPTEPGDTWASWSLAVPDPGDQDPSYVWDLGRIVVTELTAAVRDQLGDDATVRVHQLELATREHLARTRRVQAAGLAAMQQRRRRAAEHLDGAPLNIPETVTTRGFGELLGVSATRIRQLRAQRAERIAAGQEPGPFPAELFPGYWLLEDARRYATLYRPPGRPPVALAAPPADAQADDPAAAGTS